MIVVMNPRCTRAHVDRVVQLLDDMGVPNHVIEGKRRSVIELLENHSRLDRAQLERTPMVERVLDRPDPVLATRRSAESSTAEVPLGNGATVGGTGLAIIAGPCAVESAERLLPTAEAVARAGAVALRGGAFKPRTSPYAFQGHETRALEMLAEARAATGLAVVTEVMCPEHVTRVAPIADVLQVGSRNMHNTPLLRAVGEQAKPVLLKRGWSATLQEFLLAAEYIMQAGNQQVILCERGIRTHEDYVRNTLALAIVPEIKRVSDLPILVDPSHGTGQAHLVAPMSLAAIAAGADGLLIEVHIDPTRAWSDAAQTLSTTQFEQLMRGLPPIAAAMGRTLPALRPVPDA